MSDGVTLRALAIAAMSDADNATHDAAVIMVAEVNGDQELHESLILSACLAECEDVLKIVRQVVWSPPEDDGSSRVAKLAEAMNFSLYDYPLAGGLTLGDATPEQATAYAENEVVCGRTRVLRGTFVLRAAAMGKPEMPIRESVSLKRLEKVKDQVEQELTNA